MFAVLGRHSFTADVTVFEKSKVRPVERHYDPTFFGFAWGEHFARIATDLFAGGGAPPAGGEDLIVVVATVGTHRVRAAIRRSVERAAMECAWPVRPRITFASAASDPALQAADYATWAALRAAEREDPRALAQLGGAVRWQVDALARRRTHYY